MCHIVFERILWLFKAVFALYSHSPFITNTNNIYVTTAKENRFMKTLAIMNLAIFLVALAMVLFKRDLGKWNIWVFGIYGFFTFFLIELVGTGNIIDSIKAGAIVSFAMTFGVVTTRWYRQMGRKYLDHIDKEKYPLLAKYINFLRKLFRV